MARVFFMLMAIAFAGVNAQAGQECAGIASEIPVSFLFTPLLQPCVVWWCDAYSFGW